MHPKRNRKTELIEPVKVFSALMIAVLIYLIPIAYPVSKEELISGEINPVHKLLPSSADACPFKCIKCLTFDPNVWPRDCLTWYCDAQCEADSGGGGGGGPQPPSISHTLNCSQNGLTGWCIGTINIELTATDPQNASLIISGDVDGNNFTCPSGDTTCSISLNEGVGNVNYKVDASTGLSATGTTNYQLDVTTPQIDGVISGSAGTNGWYITQTLITASAFDALSGVASFEVNVNNAGYTAYADTTFSDGVHSIQFRAVDNAGNLTETAIQTILVDTITPSLSLQVNGTRGQNDFYTSTVTVTPNATDAGSGINKIEARIDNDAWTIINSPFSFSDGIHSYQVRVTDNAGNLTESNIQTVYIDVSPPAIAMDDDVLELGSMLYYSLEDTGSGLSQLRVVIEDDDEKYKKVVWLEDLNGPKFKNTIRWDGKFADGTYAAPGTYFITIKITNGAGMESIRAATIEVPVVKTTEQENIPAFVPLTSASAEPTEQASQQPASAPQTPSTRPNGQSGQAFGNTNNPFTGTSIQTSFSAKSQTAPSQTSTTSNILWGGAAATLIGATLAEWQKKREEEAARLVSMRNSGGEEGGYDDSDARRREQKIAKTNPALANSMRQERELWAAIAQVTAQEQKVWTRENTLKVEATQTYKDSDNKGQYLKREFQNIRFEEAQYRAEQQAKEQALHDYRIGEKNAVAIAEEYEVRSEEQALQFQRFGEQQAVRIAQDYEARVQERVIQVQRFGEHNAVDIANEYTKQLREKAEQAYYEGEREAERVAEQARLNAIYAERWAGVASVAEARIKDHWWEKTKSFVNEMIIQPTNTNIYQPVIKPAIEQTMANVSSLVTYLDENIYQPHIKPKIEEFAKGFNENVYQPYIQPAIEAVGDFVIVKFAEFNEKVYQPIIKPTVEKVIERTKEFVSQILSALNEKIYQPIILPMAIAANENIYQPFLQPILQKINDGFIEPFVKPLLDVMIKLGNAGERWVRESIYQPIFAPMVNDIKKYVYKPVSNAAEEVWKQYGEWVHGALDAAGFVPGFGEIADGLNGLIYLGEGRYIEASVSLLAMIPVLGDLGKTGKWTVKAGQELLEEAAEKAAKEAVEEVAEKVIKETGEETLQETGEGIVAVVTKDSLVEVAEETAEKKLKEVGEGLLTTASRESLEVSTKKVAIKTGKEFTEKQVKEVGEEVVIEGVKEVAVAVTAMSTLKVADIVGKEALEETLEKFSEETARRALKEIVEGKVSKLPADIADGLTDARARELAQKMSTELGGKKVWVSAKSGSVYISSSPAEGFILAKELSEIDLTNTKEVEKILKRIAELTSRGSGNHVVLGPFMPNGAFIQEALDTGGVFWDVGDELWKAVEDTGLDMFKLNDQFLQVQIEKRIERFDIIHTSVNKVINEFNVSPPKNWTKIKYTEKEILDLASLPDIQYRQIENSWVRLDLIENVRLEK